MLEKLKGLWVGEGDDAYLAVGFDKLFDMLSTIALYVTIAVFAGLVVYAVVVRNRDEEYLVKSRKLLVGIIAGYSIGIITVLGSFKLINYIIDEKINTNFWLVIGLFALVTVGIATTVILEKKQVKGYKWSALAFAIAFVVYAIVLLAVIPARKDDYKPLNWSMYLYSAVLVAAIVAGCVLGGKQTDYNAKSLTYGAVCVALSFALSYVKFFSLPQGGSVTFASMLPICLYSYMFGTRKGLVAGVVYGFLQFIQSPQFYQPMQAMLDYPIAFGALGLAGIARNFKFLKGNIFAEFTIGATIAILCRYFAHVISGYFVFSSWAMPGYTAVSWTFVYNLFTIADLAIVLAVGLVALASKTVRRMLKTAERV